MRYQNIELHNVWDIIETSGVEGFTTSRLPLSIHGTINPGARRMAAHGAGIEVRGMLEPGGEAQVTLQMLDTNCVPPVAVVYHGSFCGVSVHVDAEPTTIKIRTPAKMELIQRISSEQNLPYDPRLVRVLLPAIHPIRVVKIEGDLTYPTPDAYPQKKLLCYGSSITHGAHAISPMSTYASQCAWRLGYDLINLGSGGSAQMDLAVAEHIATRGDWDVATFEMGINVRTWERDRFYDAVERFVGTIVSANPDKPIFCIDVFTYDDDFKPEPTPAPMLRSVVQEIAAKHKAARVTYVDGRTILRDPTGLQVDLVHPNDNGMAEMGRELAAVIKRVVG